ncbi:MAG: U32 family peptidase C-terminal domain-containing protein [Firmicutes bacterium]|nr:U32 family peptidase C-terminal domain-containing protein [Bacillota bacterium]
MGQPSDRKPEILAPAGDEEKLFFAYRYGADAAYIGGRDFSLRANAANFDLPQMERGIRLAHELGKKIYVAVNIFATNRDIRALPAYLTQLAELEPDGLIISDPGVFLAARQYAAGIPVHISTQANTTNWQTAKFWAEQGAKRVVLARDISLEEAAEIAGYGFLETEIFVHGAMCVAYSGRCLLSSYLTGRRANAGDCAQPCRWRYALMEEKRPGVYLPLEEDERGSYVFNAKDLCLLPLLPQLAAAGHASWKIEGRNKSAYYTANIVRVYRAAADAYFAAGAGYRADPRWMAEAEAVSHRQYTLGFSLQAPQAGAYRYDEGDSLRGYDFAAVARDWRDGALQLEVRNHLAVGDRLQILLPAQCRNMDIEVVKLYDQNQNSISRAPHPKELVWMDCPTPPPASLPLLVRKKHSL